MVYHTFIIHDTYHNVSYDEISLWYISHTSHQENPACTKSFLRDNIRLTSGDHHNTKKYKIHKIKQMKYALHDWDVLSLRAGSGGLNVKGQKGAKSGLMKPNCADEKHWNMFKFDFWFKPDVLLKKWISKSGQDLSYSNSRYSERWSKNTSCIKRTRKIVKTRRIVNLWNKQ